MKRNTPRLLSAALGLMLSPSLLPAQEMSDFELLKSQLDEHSLPLVNLTTDVAALNNDRFMPGEIEIVDYQRRTDPDAESVTFRCQLRYRGSTAVIWDKKAFAVKLYDEQGEDLDADIFGIREENSWILDAMAIDRIRMRNRVCFDVWNAMSRTPYATSYADRNGTEGVFVEVFINGDYNGLYCMTDKVDRKLLGLKKAKVDDEDGSVTVRGLLYKGNAWGSGDDLRSYDDDRVDTEHWNIWELQYPDDYPSAQTWQPLMDLIDFCSDRTSDVDFLSSYRDYFYPENLADYVIFTWALNVDDNAYKNTFLSTPDITSAHRYTITPWDMDFSLGGFWTAFYPDVLVHTDRYDTIAPFNRLITQNLDGFFDLMADTWRECQNAFLSPKAVGQRLDGYARMFRESGAWQREVAKWNGNPVPLQLDLDDELQAVKDWYRRNYNHLCAQFGTVAIEAAHADSARRPEVYTLFGAPVRVAAGAPLPRGVYIVGARKCWCSSFPARRLAPPIADVRKCEDAQKLQICHLGGGKIAPSCGKKQKNIKIQPTNLVLRNSFPIFAPTKLNPYPKKDNPTPRKNRIELLTQNIPYRRQRV